MSFNSMLALYNELLRRVAGGEEMEEGKRDILYWFLGMLDEKWVNARINVNKTMLDMVVEGLVETGYMVVDIDAMLTYRLLTGVSQGLGSEVFEVGVLWHPLLDTPYIAGSSIKGAVRSYVELNGLLGKPCIEALFGEQGRRGLFFFADAYPVEPGRDGMLLIHDIVTPHYYRGGAAVMQELSVEGLGEEEKAGGANPVPIPHFAVAEGTVFRFIVGVPVGGAEASRCLEELGVAGKNRGVAAAYSVAAMLSRVLHVTGIGARTTKGYGRFRVIRARFASPGGR